MERQQIRSVVITTSTYKQCVNSHLSCKTVDKCCGLQRYFGA